MVSCARARIPRPARTIRRAGKLTRKPGMRPGIDGRNCSRIPNEPVAYSPSEKQTPVRLAASLWRARSSNAFTRGSRPNGAAQARMHEDQNNKRGLDARLASSPLSHYVFRTLHLGLLARLRLLTFLRLLGLLPLLAMSILDANAFGLGLLRFRQMQLQHTVTEGGLGLVGIHVGRQGHAAEEAAVLLLTLCFLLLLRLDGQRIVIELNIDFIRLEARYLRANHDFLVVFADIEIPNAHFTQVLIERHHPAAEGAVEDAVKLAPKLVQGILLSAR